MQYNATTGAPRRIESLCKQCTYHTDLSPNVILCDLPPVLLVDSSTTNETFALASESAAAMPAQPVKIEASIYRIVGEN